MKKIICMLLTLVTLFTLAVPAFAATVSGTVTLTSHSTGPLTTMGDMQYAYFKEDIEPGVKATVKFNHSYKNTVTYVKKLFGSPNPDNSSCEDGELLIGEVISGKSFSIPKDDLEEGYWYKVSLQGVNTKTNPTKATAVTNYYFFCDAADINRVTLTSPSVTEHEDSGSSFYVGNTVIPNNKSHTLRWNKNGSRYVVISVIALAQNPRPWLGAGESQFCFLSPAAWDGVVYFSSKRSASSCSLTKSQLKELAGHWLRVELTPYGTNNATVSYLFVNDGSGTVPDWNGSSDGFGGHGNPFGDNSSSGGNNSDYGRAAEPDPVVSENSGDATPQLGRIDWTQLDSGFWSSVRGLVDISLSTMFELPRSSYIADVMSYMLEAMKYHIVSADDNYRVSRNLADGKTILFFFDGVSSDFASGMTVKSGFKIGETRYNTSAVVIAVRLDNNTPVIVTSEICSTMPDNVRYTKANGGDKVPTVADGIHNILYWNHKGTYAALHMVDSGTVPVYRIAETGSPDRVDSSDQINIHARDKAYVEEYDLHPASTGCFNIGADKAAYNRFMQAVFGIKNAKTNKFSNAGSDAGLAIVDRSCHPGLDIVYEDNGEMGTALTEKSAGWRRAVFTRIFGELE